jgi:CHAT domain-containing protein
VEPSEADDGLLSLEEVLGLRLTSTEWVVLSACNTGADDGSGESLAGLARAFFFAGARTLLVSHWAVEDRATQVLMGEVFRRFAAGMAPAEALRAGLLAMMGHAQGPTAYLAHPFAWAPFTVVGEGR